MYQHQTSIRVRYGETDQMGYLYYGNYAQYYEVGRVEFIRSLGLTYKEMEEVHRVLMPVMSLNLRYVRPVHYDELVEVRTTLRKFPDRFITFHVEMYNEAGKLANGGSVKLCFVDAETNRSVPVPGFLAEVLQKHFTPTEGV